MKEYLLETWYDLAVGVVAILVVWIIGAVFWNTVSLEVSPDED